MRERSMEKKWDKETQTHFFKELGRMQRMNPQVAEYSIQRSYLDLFLDLPWNEFSNDQFDLKKPKNSRSGSFWFGRGEKTNFGIPGCTKVTK